MKRPLAAAALLGLAACSADAGAIKAPPNGTKEHPIRSICDAGSAFLFFDWKLRCSRGFPGSPVTGSTLYWSGERPCSRSIDYLDGQPAEVRAYDYSMPFTEPGASYDAAGNLERFDGSVFTGTTSTVRFEYDAGSVLVRAVVSDAGGEHAYDYVTEDGRRVREEDARGTYPPWHYVYDGDDRLVAEGPTMQDGALPAPYPKSFLTADAQGRLPLVPMIDVTAGSVFGVSAPQYVYFYRSDDRLDAIGAASPPGLAFERYDYRYDGDKLTSVSSTGHESVEPTFRAQTITYNYSCN